MADSLNLWENDISQEVYRRLLSIWYYSSRMDFCRKIIPHALLNVDLYAVVVHFPGLENRHYGRGDPLR
jgi:hypothetical protein